MEQKNKKWILVSFLSSLSAFILAFFLAKIIYHPSGRDDFGGVFILIPVYLVAYFIIVPILFRYFSARYKTRYDTKTHLLSFLILSWVIPLGCYFFIFSVLAPFIQPFIMFFKVLLLNA